MFRQNNISIRETGTTASVPNNDVARCMYYLKCVCSVIDCNDVNIRRFTNYENYEIAIKKLLNKILFVRFESITA